MDRLMPGTFPPGGWVASAVPQAANASRMARLKVKLSQVLYMNSLLCT
jgi:hypothetical protein